MGTKILGNASFESLTTFVRRMMRSGQVSKVNKMFSYRRETALQGAL